MATDNLLANFTNKKLMPYDMMKTYFFEYLQALAEEAFKEMYRIDGVFDAQTAVTGTATGEVSVASAFEGTDGLGKKFEFGATDSRLQDVPFQNTNSVAYHIGLRSIEMIDELDINPRTGQPEYRRKKENVGTAGTPDAVVDNGSTITLTVDSVTESGVTHAGRTVRVSLVIPEATAWADAYEDVTVAWVGSNNKITTTGLLGQTVGSVSTTVGDYVVTEIGPVLVRQATQDLKTASGVCFLAEFDGVTGSAPSPDMTDQNVLTGNLSDLATITRIANSDLKVSVRAVVADSGEDQIRAESSGGTRVWGVDEAGKHWLQNASEGKALDGSDYLGSLGLPWNTDSFSGSIAESMHTLAFAMGPAVLDGLNYSSGSGGLTLTSGSAWIPGITGVDGGMRRLTTPFINLANDDTSWVYLDPDETTLMSTTTKANAYAAGLLPLYEVTTHGSGDVLSYKDISYRTGSIHKRGIITVSSDDKSSNFNDLQAALDFVDSMMGQDSGRWPGVEIWILDDLDLGSSAAVIGSSSHGLTIRGVNWRGNTSGRSVLKYGNSMGAELCHVIIDGANDVRFIGIKFLSEKTGVGDNTSCVRTQYTPSAVTVDGTRFDGCRFTSTNDNLAFAVRSVTATWDGVIFNDCVFDLDNTTPATVSVVDYAGGFWKFVDCKIIGDDSITTIVANASYLNNSVFDRCEFVELESTGIKLNAGPGAYTVAKFVSCFGSIGEIANGNIVNCDFSPTRLVPSSEYDFINVVGGRLSGSDLIQKDYSDSKIILNGVHLSITGNYVVGGTDPDRIEIINCRMKNYQSALSTSIPFTLGTECLISVCNIGPFREHTNQGVHFISVTDVNTRISNNLIDASYYCAGVHLASGAVRSSVSENHITNPTDNIGGSGTAVGIYSEAPNCTIIGNRITNVGDSTRGGLGIYISGTYTTISGNLIANIEGAAIHITSAGSYIAINGNTIYNVGLVTITNGTTLAVSNNGMHLAGADYNTMVGNSVRTVVNDGFHVETGGVRNIIVGNFCGACGNDGIVLASGSSYAVLQLNNASDGITTTGSTNNLIGASPSNNNLV